MLDRDAIYFPEAENMPSLAMAFGACWAASTNRRRARETGHAARPGRELLRQPSVPNHAAEYAIYLAFGHHEDRTPTHGYEPTRGLSKTNDMMSWWRALGQSGGALALISIQAYGGPRQSFSL
jgi:hypothetical protein